jgi:putative acetyltransferase
MIIISKADLAAQEIQDLVIAHASFCDGTSPPESCHRLPIEGLRTPNLIVWAAYEGDVLLGIGALKTLSDGGGEIKSMHTTEQARGRGVAKAMLQHLIKEAESANMTALSLETGTHPAFAPARALYTRFEFNECPPFGDYVVDPHSVFMTRKLPVLETAE